MNVEHSYRMLLNYLKPLISKQQVVNSYFIWHALCMLLLLLCCL